MISVERTDKPGMPIRIRLNDGNHDFTEAAAEDLVWKLVSAGVATPAPNDGAKVREAVSNLKAKKFIRHLPKCEKSQAAHLGVRVNPPCTCGLDEALAGLGVVKP